MWVRRDLIAQFTERCFTMESDDATLDAAF